MQRVLFFSCLLQGFVAVFALSTYQVKDFLIHFLHFPHKWSLGRVGMVHQDFGTWWSAQQRKGGKALVQTDLQSSQNIWINCFLYLFTLVFLCSLQPLSSCRELLLKIKREPNRVWNVMCGEEGLLWLPPSSFHVRQKLCWVGCYFATRSLAPLRLPLHLKENVLSF